MLNELSLGIHVSKGVCLFYLYCGDAYKLQSN